MLFLTSCPFLSLLLIFQSFLEGLSEDRNLRTDPAYTALSLSGLHLGSVSLAEGWSQHAPMGDTKKALRVGLCASWSLAT